MNKKEENKNDEKRCSTCVFCMPNGAEKMVCSGRDYGKEISDNEMDNSIECDEYEPIPDF